MVLEVVAVWLTVTSPLADRTRNIGLHTILVYSLDAEAVANGSGLLLIA